MKWFGVLISCWSTVTVSSFSPTLLHVSHNQISHLDTTAASWKRNNVSRDWKRTEGDIQLQPWSSSLFSITTTNCRRNARSCFSTLNKLKRKYLSKLRRSMLVILLVSIVWSTAISGLHIPPASAASSTTAATQVFPEKVVEKYVQTHMFDNEMHDSVASTYRESHYDNNVGSHANALQEITTSIVGESGKLIGNQAERGVNPVASFLMSVVGFLEKRGIKETRAIALLTTLVFASASATFLVGSMAISLMFKRGINREMKARYGENCSIDATIKKEEDVEAPDDDDDDDDSSDDDSDSSGD